MKRTLLLFAFFIVMVFAGCGGDSLNRCSVSGTITLDGDPIADGYVTFKPEPGTACPVVAGRIKNGSYILPKKDGPVPGNYTVEVAAAAPTGKKVKSPYDGKESDEMASIIPTQYTGISKSILTASIVHGKNTVDLKLESGKK
jgi:hypothetical protein